MSYVVRLSVAPGGGRLARRARGCLYVPPGRADAQALLDTFLDAPDDGVASAMADFVLTRNLEAPPFVLATWPDSVRGIGIHLIVRGDAQVDSDLPSIPSLSGAGSSTWVEHRVPRNPTTGTLRAGDGAAADTDLVRGTVPAGGFELTLHDPDPAPLRRSATTPTPAEPPVRADSAEATDDEVTWDELDQRAEDATTPESPAVTDDPEPVADPAPVGGVEALRAATDGDWMEESIGIDALPDVVPAARTERSTPSEEVAPDPIVEQPAEPRVARPAEQAKVAAPPPTRAEPPPRPPVFPGDPVAADDEITIEPAGVVPTGTSTGPLTHARRCPVGHPNPPHRSTCRICGAELDVNTPAVTVEQPVLGMAELPDGRLVDLVGSVVVGRNPSSEAARCDDDATLVSLESATSVSRTHVVIRAEGWTITVTDCGSRGGSALVAGDEEPVALTEWVPHELSGGDLVYLGGPTAIRILDVTDG